MSLRAHPPKSFVIHKRIAGQSLTRQPLARGASDWHIMTQWHEGGAEEGGWERQGGIIRYKRARVNVGASRDMGQGREVDVALRGRAFDRGE